jgi:hypothetical protein
VPPLLAELIHAVRANQSPLILECQCSQLK